jgi:hypothetical protein
MNNSIYILVPISTLIFKGLGKVVCPYHKVTQMEGEVCGRK